MDDPTVPDYCVEGILDITNGAGLIIEPGVLIEFDSDAGFMVGSYSPGSGYIEANGSAGMPITFTGKVKTPGFWRGIGIQSNDIRNCLSHSIVEYAGSANLDAFSLGFGFKTGVGVGKSTNGSIGRVSISNSIIRNNDGKGYSCKDGNGLHTFVNNQFIDNTEEAIYLHVSGFASIDAATTFSGNGFDGVAQNYGAGTTQFISESNTISWRNTNGQYRISRYVELEDNTHLDILPGVEILMGSATRLTVDDAALLTANGEASNRITIRGETAGQGTWNAILFRSSSSNQLSYCTIDGGGDGVIVGNGCNGTANIGLWTWFGDHGEVTISNCELSNSGGCGIFHDVANTSLTESGNTYSGNASSNVCN